MNQQGQRRMFNVDEYYRMVEAGILTEQEQVELIEGEVQRMPPLGKKHAACVDRLIYLFHSLYEQKAQLRVRNPLLLDDFSEPQPDFMILKPRKDFYAQQAPRPKDVLLLIEVADSSLLFDKQVKIPLYAQHSIEEVWLVDQISELIYIHKKPGEQSFLEIQMLRRGENLSPKAFPKMVLQVDDLIM